MRKYKHHLYPRYMAKKGEIPPWGDSNLVVEVSFTQHLMFHWCNYQLWGNSEDYVAYCHMKGCGEEGKLAATKLANKAFLAKMESDPSFSAKIRENGRKAAQLATEARLAKIQLDPEFAEKARLQAESARKKTLSPEARAKRLETLRKNNHQQGPKNSQYGTMWITDGTSNRKIKKGDPIPKGFRSGRTLKPNG